MNIRRIAVPVAAGTLTLLALGGTAVALGSTGTPAPTPVAVTSTSSPTSSPTTTPTAAAGETMSEELARELAVAQAGGGTVTNVEQEVEHGRLEWKVDVLRDGVQQDIRIDAATGTVARHDTSDDRATTSPTTPPAPASTRSAPPTTDDRGRDRGYDDNPHADDRGGDDDHGRGGDDDHGGNSGRG